MAIQIMQVACQVWATVAKQLVLVVVLAIGFAGLAQAGCDLDAGIDFHNAARQGDETAVPSAIECLEALEQQTPEDVRVLAYLGSAYALKARYSDSVVDRVRFTNLGLDSLDYAVELAPDNFEVRLIRWNVNHAVPSMFGRKQMLIEDLHQLHAIYQKAQNPGMAQAMVPVYAHLEELEPGNVKWQAMKATAERLAKQVVQ